MRAVMKVGLGAGNIEIRDIPEPEPGPGQVKIAVRAAGICGTDLHIYYDEFRTEPPVVLGHEIAGLVAAVGDGVDNVALGARVTTETYFSTCGVCQYCRSGHKNLCLQRKSIGSKVNGGFTNYVIVPAGNVHCLPEGVDFEAGALTEPLACVVHAVLTHHSIAPGDIAVIAGPGAIGLLTLQVVKAAGATAIVLGTDQDWHRLALARDLGADHVANVQRDDPLNLVTTITPQGQGADVVYECSGAGPAVMQLLQLVRRGGRYVQVGLFGKPVMSDLDQICYREITLTGSNASTPPAWTRALQLMAHGQVRTAPLITGTYPVTEWKTAFNVFESKSGIKLILTPVD
jgi:L-iditol 2-dehydrogenase